jgi:hypothetical protein
VQAGHAKPKLCSIKYQPLPKRIFPLKNVEGLLCPKGASEGPYLQKEINTTPVSAQLAQPPFAS